ncbi:hypothetical protein C8F01DRAFT_1136307 [Mycena amicta]|nr:hypothetical protein C8F01DRAFT_1136307 [Mycena amicta]
MASGAASILGPVISSAFLVVFLFGIVCMQAVHYLKTFPNDALFVKCTVVALWILLLGYVVCVCQGAYIMAVVDFGHVFALIYSPWGEPVALILGGTIDHCVQAFFVIQIFRATRAPYLCIFLGIMVALLQVLSGVLNADLLRTHSIAISSNDPRFHRLMLILFFADAAMDLVNAAALCFYLRVQRQSAFSRSTVMLVNQLVVYTLQTGFTTSLVSLATAISFKVNTENYVWVIFFQAMPCSFMSALLANINNRGSLRNLKQTSQSYLSSGATNSRSNHGDGAPVNFQVQISRSITFARDIDPNTSASSAKAEEEGEIELNRIELDEHRKGEAV